MNRWICWSTEIFVQEHALKYTFLEQLIKRTVRQADLLCFAVLFFGLFTLLGRLDVPSADDAASDSKGG